MENKARAFDDRLAVANMAYKHAMAALQEVGARLGGAPPAAIAGENAADVAAAAAAHASAAAAAARDDPSPETEAEAQTAAAIAREAAEMATRAAAKATSTATRASADDVNRRIAAARDAMRGAEGFDAAPSILRDGDTAGGGGRGPAAAHAPAPHEAHDHVRGVPERGERRGR